MSRSGPTGELRKRMKANSRAVINEAVAELKTENTARVRRADIEKARAMYLSGECELSEAAVRTGVRYHTLRGVCLREGWQAERDERVRVAEQDAENALARMVAQRKRKAIKDQLDRAELLSRKGLETLNTAIPLAPGLAIDALKVASEMERKVLKLEEQSAVAQVNILMPLFAASEAQHVTTMLKELNDGERLTEATGRAGADSADAEPGDTRGGHPQGDE